MKNWFEELMSEHRRRAQRYIEPRLVAFYWDGAVPKPRYIRDVSMTLQRTEKSDDGLKSSIAVQAKVIRPGEDGAAMAFVFPKAEDARRVTSIVAGGVGLADRNALDLFLQPLWINRPIGHGGGSW
jgi:hypothetical protein